MLESEGNIAACVGWELSAFHGLAAFSASPCPGCHRVPHALVCDKSHSAVGNSGSQWLCSFSFFVFQTAKSSLFGLKKGFPGKQQIQMCFCSQHPAVVSSAISLTSSSPADSWSILEQSCAQSHLLLHAGAPGTQGPQQCRVQQALGSCSCRPGKSGSCCEHRPPHTHSCRPWLLLPGVRCNKGD